MTDLQKGDSPHIFLHLSFENVRLFDLYVCMYIYIYIYIYIHGPLGLFNKVEFGRFMDSDFNYPHKIKWYHCVKRVLNLQIEDRYLSEVRSVPRSRTESPTGTQWHFILCGQLKSESMKRPLGLYWKVPKVPKVDEGKICHSPHSYHKHLPSGLVSTTEKGESYDAKDK